MDDNIKISIVVYSESAVSDATEITNKLKDENLRGVKVKQAEAAVESGVLSVAEYLPVIELVIKSGLATAVATQVFSLLQNGFFTKSKEIKSNEKIELAKIASAEKIAAEKNKLACIKIQLEHNGPIESFDVKNEAEADLVLTELMAQIDRKYES